MAYKFVILAALVAVAKAGILGAPAVYAPGAPVGYAAHGPIGYAAPAIAHAPIGYASPAYGYAAPAIAKVAGPAIDTDYDPNPSYSYAYDIQDALTGDYKNQQESRQGDNVQGSYSLVEPDGTRRTVEYVADPINGFNAVVHREPAVAAVAKVHAPVAVAHAPVGLAAPLGYGHGLASPLGYGHGLAAPVGLASPLGYGHGLAAPVAYGGYGAPLGYGHTKALIG